MRRWRWIGCGNESAKLICSPTAEARLHLPAFAINVDFPDSDEPALVRPHAVCTSTDLGARFSCR
jgi:hypothetical protein